MKITKYRFNYLPTSEYKDLSTYYHFKWTDSHEFFCMICLSKPRECWNRLSILHNDLNSNAIDLLQIYLYLLTYILYMNEFRIYNDKKKKKYGSKSNAGTKNENELHECSMVTIRQSLNHSCPPFRSTSLSIQH